MYVQYDCHRSSTFRDLLRKRSARQNIKIGHSSEPEVCQIAQKAQLDPLGMLCVKFEDNRTSTFRDMLRKRIVYQRPNAVTSSFSPLRPCVLNSD